MPLPADVPTFTLTFGRYLRGDGAVSERAGQTWTIRPSTRLIHEASGDVILPDPIPFTFDADGRASVGPLPYTDTDRLTPWGFTWVVTMGRDGEGARIRVAVPQSEGPVVDFDQLEDAPGAPGVLVPGTSINGLTGATTVVAGANVTVTTDAATKAITVASTATGGTGGVTDHGLLTGLADDDHPQYLTAARGDVRYPATTDPRLSDARTPTAHQHPAADLSDSTVTGRAVVTAADAAAARTAIGAASPDRATHTGTQSLDTTTDTGTRVAMTPAERTKLSGVATGATANATDAALRDRATHTGTQSADTIVDGTTNRVFTATDEALLDGASSNNTANALVRRDSVGGFITNSVSIATSPASASAATRKDWVEAQDDLIPRRLTTAGFTLGLGDAGWAIDVDSSTAATVTIPTHATAAIPLHSFVFIRRNGTTVSITPATGVTLRSPDNARDIAVQYGVVMLHKIADDVWEMSGDLNDATYQSVAGATNNATANALARRDSGGAVNMQQVNLAATAPTLAAHATRKDWVEAGLAGKANTAHTHGVTDLTATGTRDATTVLHGDNTWKAPAAGSSSTYGLVTSMAAGYWSIPTHGSRGTLASNDGRLFMTPFFPDPNGPLIDALACEVTTAVAGTSAYLGIYSRDSATGITFTLRQSFGQVLTDTVGRKDAVFAAGFDHKPYAGRLVLATVAVGGAPSLRAYTNSGMVSVPTTTPEGTTSGIAWRQDLGAGVTGLPATVTTPNMDFPGTAAPILFFRAKA